jgi:hypothetical protein
MIKDIIELLNVSDWLIGDKDIDVAKGMYKAPNNIKDLKQTIKRKNYKDGR